MKMVQKLGLGLAGALASAALASAGTPPALYTAAQSAAGATVFAQNCAMCHGADLKGAAGPALIGQAFAPASDGATIGAIFTVIVQQMPASAPGSLSQEQYTDVMAYILNKNGYPAGAAPLAYTASLTSTAPLVAQVP